jgi:hypothetical protein
MRLFKHCYSDTSVLDVLFEARVAPSEARCEALLVTCARQCRGVGGDTRSQSVAARRRASLFNVASARNAVARRRGAQSARRRSARRRHATRIGSLLDRHAAVACQRFCSADRARRRRRRSRDNRFAHRNAATVAADVLPEAAPAAALDLPGGRRQTTPRFIALCRAFSVRCAPALRSVITPPHSPTCSAFVPANRLPFLSRHSSRFFKARHKRRVGLGPVCNGARRLWRS